MAEILVTGYPYWAGVAAGMLQKAGLDAARWEVGPQKVPAAIRWCRPLRLVTYLLDRPFRKARVIHYVGSVSSLLFLRVARCLGKRVVLHWVGTDVMKLGESVEGGNRRLLKFYKAVPHFHFADSPEIAEELAALGISAQVFRLLPDSVTPRDLPMPERPAVLVYWSPERREFYGGRIIDALAEEFPQVRFYVVGSSGEGAPQHPNMKYLGWLESLEEIYRKVSVLIRLPEHDSLSVMVLEMLSRGRWVIYSKPFPHTEFAADLDEARLALRRCLSRTGKNEAGQEYVQRSFSPEAQRIAPLYRAVLAGTPRANG